MLSDRKAAMSYVRLRFFNVLRILLVRAYDLNFQCLLIVTEKSFKILFGEEW